MKEQTSSEPIEIKDCRAPVFKLILRFLYGGQVTLSADNAQEVLMAADRFQIPQLKRLVESYLSGVVDPANALDIRALARHANSEPLEKACTRFALHNLGAVVGEQQLAKEATATKGQQPNAVEMAADWAAALVGDFFGALMP